MELRAPNVEIIRQVSEHLARNVIMLDGMCGLIRACCEQNGITLDSNCQDRVGNVYLDLMGRWGHWNFYNLCYLVIYGGFFVHRNHRFTNKGVTFEVVGIRKKVEDGDQNSGMFTLYVGNGVHTGQILDVPFQNMKETLQEQLEDNDWTSPHQPITPEWILKTYCKDEEVLTISDEEPPDSGGKRTRTRAQRFGDSRILPHPEMVARKANFNPDLKCRSGAWLRVYLGYGTKPSAEYWLDALTPEGYYLTMGQVVKKGEEVYRIGPLKTTTKRPSLKVYFWNCRTHKWTDSASPNFNQDSSEKRDPDPTWETVM